MRITTKSLVRRQRHTDAEQGSVSLENILIFPVLLLLVFGIFQLSLWYSAQSIAHLAATSGYNSSKAYGSNNASGTESAYSVLSDSSSSISGTNVSIARTPTQITITVTGTSPSVIPGWGGPNVTATVSGPVERWTQP